MLNIDLKFILLTFGIVFLLVLLTRKAIKKVTGDKASQPVAKKGSEPASKALLTEAQFDRSWKSLSYLILLAAAGNLYMVYTAVKAALSSGLVFFWIDAGCSLLAAVAAVVLWKMRTRTWVFLYFTMTALPVMMFLSLKGPGFKESAMIHLFPLVLLYFILKPVWANLKD
jgi:hypothetical protein